MCPPPKMMDATMQYDVPVDSEHKSLKIKIFSFAQPHMRAFHWSWFGFFTTFISTFAPAALIPAIRDVLSLNKQDLANAGISAVTGTVGARVVMGSLCDLMGARYGMAGTMLLTAAPTFGMALANSPMDFIMCRFGIGFGLATFVCCQYWTTSMFNVQIVGLANATAAGWGNLGGGVTHLLMPVIFTGIAKQVAPFIAWRWSFFIPGFMHIIAGMGSLMFTVDTPDGNFSDIIKSGSMKKDKGYKVFINAVSNYRTLVLMIIYAACFGVELVMDNIITAYLFDQFELKYSVAGLLGAIFGLSNIFARASGGWASDLAAKRWGMRGRLWVLFWSSFLGGVFCLAMGLAKDSLSSTIVLMFIFSIFCQATCGTSFGVVPFVSKRSMGVISGFVGAGGNLGAVMTQYLFFFKESMETYKGIEYTGIFMMAAAMTTALLWFPMWGSMFTSGRDDVTEEDFYMSEYTAEERASGLADAAMRFANESKSQRGNKAALKNVDEKSVEDPSAVGGFLAPTSLPPAPK